MSASDFFAEALPYAQRASSATGVFVSVILAQWFDETWDPQTQSPGPDWTVRHNPGNVSPDGDASYPTLDAGVDAWIVTMDGADYVAVREAPTPTDQAYALGRSPWASSHYEEGGPPPGQDLVTLMATYDLGQYDHQGPAEPPEDALMCYDPDRQVVHGIAVVNGVPYHWYQPTSTSSPVKLPPGTPWGVERLEVPA